MQIGYILDTYVLFDKAIIWIKTLDGKCYRFYDEYRPELYIKPADKEAFRELYSQLASHPNVISLDIVEKPVGLNDEKEDLIEVYVDSTKSYKKLVNALQSSRLVGELFNIDLLHIQKYIFNKLRIAPTSKVYVKLDNNNHMELKVIDDSRTIEPPPFNVLHVNFKLGEDYSSILRIKLCNDRTTYILEGPEKSIIEKFAYLMKDIDPDIIVFNILNKALLRKIRKLVDDLGISLNRNNELGGSHIYNLFDGRVTIYEGDFNYGLAGLIERARFSYLPIRLASKYTANRLIDSRNCFELIKKGHVIPENKGGKIHIRKLDSIAKLDRGGLIVPPRLGVVHENVAELDFESQYPSIIVKYCLSYETCFPNGIKPKRDALLPMVTKEVLDRRLYFKHLRNKFPKSDLRWKYCDDRQNALKMILVCLYGTSGCTYNRFNNIITFEEINRISREILIKAINIVMNLGYEVIYADTDSIFIKKRHARIEDYMRVCHIISREVGLPISINNHYKYIVFLQSKSRNESIDAQKRFFGLLSNGEIIARGIELRRHDTPKLIKELQKNLIKELFKYDSLDEVYNKGYRDAQLCLEKTLRRIINSEVPIEDLIITKRLRKSINEYKRLFPHVSAAFQLANRETILKGKKIKFIIKKSNHENPLSKVSVNVHDTINYDKKWYVKMAIRAAETIFSALGFKDYSLKMRY